jgi:hypothetical protein
MYVQNGKEVFGEIKKNRRAKNTLKARTGLPALQGWMK